MSGVLHVAADKGTRGCFVGLATIGVALFTDGQDGGVGRSLFLHNVAGGCAGGGHVHRDGRRGRVKWLETASIFFDGDSNLMAIMHAELSVHISGKGLLNSGVELVFRLAHARRRVFHALNGRG